MGDVLASNATIVDGTGRPAFHGDVAIHDGRIVGVGDNVDSVTFANGVDTGARPGRLLRGARRGAQL
jgi:N-acyl-D-aspartate/D-glutamate deacylase